MFPFRSPKVLVIPVCCAPERNLKIAPTGQPPEAVAFRHPRLFPRGGAEPTLRRLRAHGVGPGSKSAWFPMIKRLSLFPALSCDLIKKEKG